MRTDFPNTNGAYVAADGNPLVEIKSDGTPAGTVNRPTGFTMSGDLQNDGDKAAFTYQMARYFSGAAAADAYKADLQFWTKAVRPDAPTPEQTKYFDDVDTARAANGVIFDRAMATGVYTTPLPSAAPSAPAAPAAPATPAAPAPSAPATPSPVDPPAAAPAPAPTGGSQDPQIVQITNDAAPAGAPAAPVKAAAPAAPVVLAPEDHAQSLSFITEIEHVLGWVGHPLMVGLRKVLKHS
jgi:hypothetical protein